jgi:ABC-type Na+ efflux pump permease subunit
MQTKNNNMKILGVIVLVIGLVGLVFFGIEAMNQSESFSLFGVDVAVSSANWTPVIVSAVVAVIGFFIMKKGK